MDQKELMAQMLASGAGPGGGAAPGGGAPPSPPSGDPIQEAAGRLAQMGITPENAMQVMQDIQLVQEAMGGGGAPAPGGPPPGGMPPVA